MENPCVQCNREMTHVTGSERVLFIIKELRESAQRAYDEGDPINMSIGMTFAVFAGELQQAREELSSENL